MHVHSLCIRPPPPTTHHPPPTTHHPPPGLCQYPLLATDAFGPSEDVQSRSALVDRSSPKGSSRAHKVAQSYPCGSVRKTPTQEQTFAPARQRVRRNLQCHVHGCWCGRQQWRDERASDDSGTITCYSGAFGVSAPRAVAHACGSSRCRSCHAHGQTYAHAHVHMSMLVLCVLGPWGAQQVACRATAAASSLGWPLWGGGE